MKRILFIFTFVATILFGCTYMPTKYKEGTYEKTVHNLESDNIRKVGFKWDKNTSSYYVYYYTLLKAAETTVNNGYNFFVAFENNNSDSNNVSLYSGNSLGSSAPRVIKDNYYEMQIYMFKDLKEIPNATIYHNASNILLSRKEDITAARKGIFFIYSFTIFFYLIIDSISKEPASFHLI